MRFRRVFLVAGLLVWVLSVATVGAVYVLGGWRDAPHAPGAEEGGETGTAANRGAGSAPADESATPALAISLDPALPAEITDPARRLVVRGTVSEWGCAVRVNGRPAVVSGRDFTAEVALRAGSNAVEIVATAPGGSFSRALASVTWTGRSARTAAPGDLWWEPTPAQRSAAERSGQPLWFENDIGMRFVLMPDGSFVMGSPAGEAGRRADEAAHRVAVSAPFYLGATEVTNAQMRRFRPHHASRSFQGRGLDGEAQPAVQLSFEDALALCAWLSEQEGEPDAYRLPTEAEWELACRAGASSAYPWGAALDPALCNSADRSGAAGGDDGFAVTAPVASYPPNAVGLHDMIGNVKEWCADWYGPYAPGEARDPRGPSSGEQRVLRGGSWLASPAECRAAARSSYPPVLRDQLAGVRLVARHAPARRGP